VINKIGHFDLKESNNRDFGKSCNFCVVSSFLLFCWIMFSLSCGVKRKFVVCHKSYNGAMEIGAFIHLNWIHI
jgi:hypothetical protein